MKLRVRSTKIGEVRFTSHRDAARMWERALRRAQLPVAASEGFTPRPKISFGLALPTGAESIAEYVDIELRSDIAPTDVDLDTLTGHLSAALPTGFDVLAVVERESGVGSLQEAVTSCTWELWSPLLTADDHHSAQRLLDLRPTPSGDRLVADLVTIGRALRPAELAELAYPHVDARDVRALRTHQWLDHDDGRREVLPLPADVDARTLAVPA